MKMLEPNLTPSRPRTKTFVQGALLAFFLFALSQSAVHASSNASRAPRQQLALEVAVVAAHEGAFDNQKDTALIWQVVETNGGDTVQKRLSFLRRHSPRALGEKPCVRKRPDVMANCEWSVPLLENPDASPPVFEDAEWWAVARAPAWKKIRAYAWRLVSGLETWRPCPTPPRSWGYAGDVDKALSRGLVPIGCNEVMNDGFTFMPKSLSAEIARGKTRRSDGL